ncbi:lipocalin family protein [Nitrosomonas sp.]|uniref:lipocalin family protein n=1 Tax=Nitrosomonas sp. TaxID=42353 RepID=UPI0026182955|nr:lipocalin family protein [Nitrosomonas sp.]MCW5601147.1 lipocalin family protein [Nitrosomonas sp.]
MNGGINSYFILFLLYLLLSACTHPPRGIVPVSNFQLDRYLGKWYEIARLDHSFERGLSDVSAHYRLQPDGNIEVINRGYDASKDQWREAIGVAKFIGEPTVGALKVSFFGPFYGGYHIAELDRQDYRWVLIVGASRNYCWILARDRTITAELRQQLINKARQLDIDTDSFIWVAQERPDT